MMKKQSLKCNTTPFWKTVEDMSIFKRLGLPIVQPFPNLSSLAARYRQLSERLGNEFEYPVNGQELYTRDVYMDSDLTYGYELTWDIAKAHQLIKQHQIPIQAMKISDLLPTIYPETLNYANLSAQKAADPTPVILAEFKLTKELLVIDGNHRVVSRYQYQTGPVVNCYLLTHDIMLEALADRKLVLLYQMHHNLTVIMNYMVGNIPRVTYDLSERNHAIRLFDI